MYSKANRWTPEQDAQLAAMRARGFGFEAIALAVGHTAAACAHRASSGGYASPATETKKRARKRIPCMNDRCKKPFMSEGPGHRLCPDCRHQSLSVFDRPAQVLR
jgi:hypothetical protein